MKKRVCFYARVKNKSLFQLVEFYNQDIKIFEALGYEVILANTLQDLLFAKADVYYAWWYGYGVLPLLIAKVKNKPFFVSGAVHTQECGGLEMWPKHKQFIMKLTMRYADKTLFISNTDFQRLNDFRPKNFDIVPCSLDMNHDIRVQKEREEIVITITHLTKENIKRKMLLECIEAFSLACQEKKNLTYLICGTLGDGLSTVEDTIRKFKMQNHIKILGRVSESEKNDLLQKSKVYLQPSTCEGFGLAILEAENFGLPVVTNHEPCIEEINKNGVSYGDSIIELSNEIKKLFTDESHWREMQKKGLENVQRFGFDERLSKFKTILTEIGKLN